MKKIIVWLCILALVPTLFISAFAIDPFDSTELDEHTVESSSGTKTTKYSMKHQYYRFQLWENQWNEPVGGTGTSYFNEATVTIPSLAGRIRPFGQSINAVNIGTEVGDTINNGFYLPLTTDAISTYDFFVGFNIKMLSVDYIPLDTNQDIYGNLYLYFVNANGEVKYKTSNVFRYQWKWHQETDTLEMYCLVTVNLKRDSLPSDAVGIVPVYTFRTIQIGAIGTEQGGDKQVVYMFFPQFYCEYKSNLYDNLWAELVKSNLEEEGFFGYIGSGFKKLFSSFDTFVDLYASYALSIGFVSDIIDEIMRIPFVFMCVMASLVIGSIGAFLGIASAVNITTNSKEAANTAIKEKKQIDSTKKAQHKTKVKVTKRTIKRR